MELSLPITCKFVFLICNTCKFACLHVVGNFVRLAAPTTYAPTTYAPTTSYVGADPYSYVGRLALAKLHMMHDMEQLKIEQKFLEKPG